MDIFKQNKLLIWLVAILILLNLVILGGIWIMKTGKYPTPPPQTNFPPPPGQHFIPPPDRLDGFAIELKFNPEQMEKFKALRKKYHEELKPIMGKIHENKKLILKEILSSESDTIKIKEFTKEIGLLQSEIEGKIFRQFKEIKALCDDEQKKHFDKIINDILEEPKPNPVSPP